MINKIFTAILCLMLFINVYSQDYIFFNDSPYDTYYDPSWGFANAPSILERINDSKFPVSTNYFYTGLNSLKLKWNSKAGGDWGIAVAEDGWIGHNVFFKDSLSFYVYTNTILTSANLPVVFIEDLNNIRTPKQNLSNYSGNIPANVWTKISVPLSIFKSNPGATDLTKIKTIFFGQAQSDGVEHILYIDDIRMTSEGIPDLIKPSAPQGIIANGYEMHVDLKWMPNTELDLMGYYLYRYDNSNFIRVAVTSKDVPFFTDFLGSSNLTGTYKITAFDSSNNESLYSDEVTASTHQMTDDEFLDMTQLTTFRFFYDYAHPTSGLTRERLGSGEIVTTGGSGFGVMALLVGVERGFITREQGATRMLKIANFLKNNADRFHGAFAHWFNGTNGTVIPFSTIDNGGDLVETAYLIQGLLAARQYFNQSNANEELIRNLITQIWEGVEWNWYRRYPTGNLLYWHWSPNYGWQMNFPLSGPNETMITYLLAIASPTYGVPSSLYANGWASSNYYTNTKSFYGYRIWVGWDYGGPLFFQHYSLLGFDPRNIKDAYANYFNNAKNITLIHKAYCTANPNGFAGYNANCWGLTASDDPFGYSAHEPTNDNGTITPSAALSSMPYTPQESIEALKYFYRTYGAKVWGAYGFKDAFNPTQNWYANSYISIDQGPIICMIENYRSQLLWNKFMANPEIQPMLTAIGFVTDPTDVDEGTNTVYDFNLAGNYPNPFNPSTTIQYSVPNAVDGMTTSKVTLKVYDILGSEVAILVNGEKSAGKYEVRFDAGNLTSGAYFYKLTMGNKSLYGKMILQK
jgi:hypothetical protein